MMKAWINNQEVEFTEGESILQVAKKAGIFIPTLCAFLPDWIRSALFDGIWRTASWVTAVMLPPMAIFFPLFTLLEDFGYLPRVAFLLDHAFQKARACGKQALTMCIVYIIL